MGTGRHKRQGQSEPGSPGHVTVDSRGRNVWQWDDSQLDSTTIMLRSLDNAELALEPTRQVRRPASTDSGNDKKPASNSSTRVKESTGELKIEQTISFKLGGGFDPYNRS